jgi:hypothetical protein
MLTQPSTLYGGNAQPRMGMLDLQGIPGLQGGLGSIISMALQPLLMQMTQSAGFAGLQFGGQQNLYDRMTAQDFFLQSRQAVQEASRRDEEHYYQRILGVSRLTGTIVGPEQERVAHTMARDISRMAVYLGDAFPETFDEMHGIRGSAAMMARRIHLGGRYALDPITGEIGMRGETAGAISNQVYENLFGPDADLGAMRGFGAGRMGQLYDELQRRGFMGGVVNRETAFLRAFRAEGRMDARTLAESLVRDPNRRVGITAQEFQQLEANEPGQGVQRVMESTEVRGMVTSTQARRISDRLRNMVGAVSAMRDIFGDMGRPDAPMAELINGLQALTQGGLANMDPQQLEMMVRRTQQLSRVSGISMQGMMQLMSRGAGMADQMGLDRRFAVLATQGATAFGTAFSNVDPGTPGWRMPDKDTLTSIDQSLRLTAARSDQANQLNATMRIMDEVISRRPGFNRDNPQTQFEALAQAIQNNQTQYAWGGQQQNVAIPMQRWLELAAGAGINRNTALALRTDAFANQEYGARYNTGNLVRFMQRQIEIDPFLRNQAEVGLQDVPGTREQRQTMGRRLVEVLWGNDLQGRPVQGGMTPTQLRDPNQRFDIMVRTMRQEANRMGVRVTDDQLRQAAVNMWAGTEEQMQRIPAMQGYQGLLGLLTANNPAYLLEADAVSRRVNDRAQIASALSGLGRGGMLRNFMDVLEFSDLNRPIGQIIGEVAGGVPREAFGAAMTDFNRRYEQYRAIQPDTPAHRDARHDLEQQMQHLAERSGLGNMNRAQLFSNMFRIGEMRRQYEQWSGRLADPNISPRERANIVGRRQDLLNQIQTVATEARQQADALGENITDIDPVHTRLTTALSGTTDPKELSSMLETFDRVRDRLRGQTVHGQNIRSEADVERILTDKGARSDLIKQLGGEDDLKKIDQVIKVLRGESIADNRIGSSDRPAVARLEGPLRIEGSVEIVGNRIIARDVVTGNHRNPVIQDEGGLI